MIQAYSINNSGLNSIKNNFIEKKFFYSYFYNK